MNVEHEKDLFEDPTKYRTALDNITNRQLTPESIDTYAEDALDDLIGLTSRVTWDYRRMPTVGFSSDRETENAAFDYFGMDNIEDILDNIDDIGCRIRDLDDVISHAEALDRVVVPPDAGAIANLGGGNGEYESSRLVPRLKTLLFILQQEFDIDVRDNNRVTIKTGTVNHDMVRKTSYNAVDVPELERTVLVCDEEGNATYIFDSAHMEQYGINGRELLELTKSDINELIQEDPGLGRKIIYTDHFIANLSAALRGMGLEDGGIEAAGRYLLPIAPDGYLTQKGIATDLKISYKPVVRAIAELGLSLGETRRYRSPVHNGSYTYYSPEQQAMLREWIESNGTLAELVPDEVLSLSGMRELHEIHYHQLIEAVQVLSDELGEVKTYKFGKKVALGYTPEQQVLILRYIREKQNLAPPAPQGIISRGKLMRRLGISSEKFSKGVEGIENEVGEVKRYKFVSQVDIGYTPEQQSLIESHLRDRGLVLEKAPSDYKTKRGMRGEWHVSDRTVDEAISALGDELGEVGRYIFGTTQTQGYSPEQQAMIWSCIQSRRSPMRSQRSLKRNVL